MSETRLSARLMCPPPSETSAGLGFTQRSSPTGKLPKGAQYIEHRVNGLRRQLEKHVLALRGEVTLTDAAHINSAIKWERHSALALRWLRHEEANMSDSDRLKYSREIADASDKRDRAIRHLNLDRDSEHDLIEVLYSKGG